MVQILRSLGDRSLRQLVDLERGLVNREVGRCDSWWTWSGGW